MLALLNAPPLFGLRQALAQYFAGEGFIYGFESVTDLRSTMAAVFSHLLAPVLVMGARDPELPRLARGVLAALPARAAAGGPRRA